MKKILILFSLCGFIQQSAYSQGYKIQGEITGLKDTSLILGYYSGNKFGETGGFAADTAFSKNGKFIFEGKEKLKGGLYFILIPEQQQLELIISEQRFSFKTNLANMLNIEFTNSKENSAFRIVFRYNKAKEL